MSRLALRYSVDLTEPGTCFLLADGSTVRAQIHLPSGKRAVVELPLCYRHSRGEALQVRPLDAWTWLVEPAVVHKDLARVELVLTDIPPSVSGRLKEI